MVAAHTGKKHTMPNHVALLERGGRWQLLSDAWDHPVDSALRWAGDASALYFTAQEHGRAHLYRFAIASRTAAVAVHVGWVQGFDVAGDVVASVADSLMHPARVHAVRDGHAPLRLEAFNDALLAGLRLGEVKAVSVEGAHGEPIQMWLTYPPGFDRAKAGGKQKLPVLHSIHGGPHAAAGDTFHYRRNTHAFVAQDYVVACVSHHG